MIQDQPDVRRSEPDHANGAVRRDPLAEGRKHGVKRQRAGRKDADEGEGDGEADSNCRQTCRRYGARHPVVAVR